MKVNKYQKLVLLLYGLAFIYFTAFNVPFKIGQGSEIVYDTLFSNRANVDFSRLSLVIIIITLISGILFLVVRNVELPFKSKFKPHPKLKRAILILIGVVIVTASAFLLIHQYGNSFNLNKTFKKIDSTTVAKKPNQKIQSSLPIFDTTSKKSIRIPFLKNKYLYNGKTFDFFDIADAAKQSNLDIGAYIKKAGIIEFDEKGLPIYHLPY